MLGSVQDAEDALQEALLRAWRGLPKFEGRSSLRSWLYKIATNACLDAIGRRPKRVVPVDYLPEANSVDPREHDEQRAKLGREAEPLVESVWVEPYPDERIGVEDGFAAPEARYEQREGVELAFIAALQHLPPNQRAALILREVMGFSAEEVAEAMETTVPSVNSALQRARTAVDERLPEQSQQATLRSLGDKRQREVVERFADALERGDSDALLALLAEDATWSMPPMESWYRGHEIIASFLETGPFTVRWRHLPARANGQLAVGSYSWDEQRQRYVAAVFDVLTLTPTHIADITSFIYPEVFETFGLPHELPA
jgi:RNA polymerase sigma-70 factor (ECF subfamily)